MTMKKQSHDFFKKNNLEGSGADLRFEFKNISLYFMQLSEADKCIPIMRSF